MIHISKRSRLIMLAGIVLLLVLILVGNTAWPQFPYLLSRIILALFWLGASVWILWFAIKMPLNGWRKTGAIVLGVLAVAGLAVAFVIGHALSNWEFRQRLTVYALTHARSYEDEWNLYPTNSEFLYADVTLYDYEGQRVLFPGNSDEKFVNVFGKGWFAAGRLHDGTITLTQEKYETSLWWLFTNVDLFNLIVDVEDDGMVE